MKIIIKNIQKIIDDTLIQPGKQHVDNSDLLTYQENPYHAYHFKCTTCKKVLESDARTIKDDLFCPRCFDFKCEVCFDCKKVIDPQVEQSIFTMNKHWHTDVSII